MDAKPLSVTEVTRRIKLLVNGLGTVEVEGEISNVVVSQNGHMYLSLKDTGAQISAVIFAGTLRTLPVKPQNGQKVVVAGQVDVYAPRGSYQLLVRKLRLAGQGDLMARFIEMKEKLNADGLFEQAHKKRLPALPLHIGVVTAPTGAAVRDIIRTFARRYPGLDILIAPVHVQGAGAAEEIAAGVYAMNLVGVKGSGLLEDEPRRDVVIVARGGGSLEDLWAFNEEVVARAIYASEIPVISGVGHEIDTSISDLVADVRASTPTAAAEMAIRPRAEFENGIRELGDKMSVAIGRRLENLSARLKAAEKNRVFSEPRHAVESYSQQLDHACTRMESALADAATASRKRLDRANSSLSVQHARFIPTVRARIDVLAHQLSALNPTAVLERGYSITMLENGRALRKPEEAPSGTRLVTRLSKGTVASVAE